MKDEADNESVTAALRSDAPTPFLHLWDATMKQTIAPEYADYPEETMLYAHLQREMCSSQRALRLDVEELAGLVESLRELTGLRTHQSEWKTYDGVVEIRLNVQMEKLGPPVLCDVWLRDAISVREEHHCQFETNLTWIDGFLAAMERMAFRYRRARLFLGQG
jgi:hypothetical protein